MSGLVFWAVAYIWRKEIAAYATKIIADAIYKSRFR